MEAGGGPRGSVALTAAPQCTVVERSPRVRSVAPGPVAILIRVPAKVLLQMRVGGGGGCEPGRERTHSPSGVVPNPCRAPVRRRRARAEPVALVREGRGAQADSLRLVRHLRRPVLTRDALAGPADRTAVLLPDAVVAVCGGRGRQSAGSRPSPLAPSFQSQLGPYLRAARRRRSVGSGSRRPRACQGAT